MQEGIARKSRCGGRSRIMRGVGVTMQALALGVVSVAALAEGESTSGASVEFFAASAEKAKSTLSASENVDKVTGGFTAFACHRWLGLVCIYRWLVVVDVGLSLFALLRVGGLRGRLVGNAGPPDPVAHVVLRRGSSAEAALKPLGRVVKRVVRVTGAAAGKVD